MGGKLFATLLAAGLPAPQMVAAARVEGGAKSPFYDFIASTMRSLLPIAEPVGVLSAADVEIDAMAERLRQEALGKQCMCHATAPYRRLDARALA